MAVVAEEGEEGPVRCGGEGRKKERKEEEKEGRGRKGHCREEESNNGGWKGRGFKCEIIIGGVAVCLGVERFW